MSCITNDVTFIETGDSANALTITGGEKYHTHTRAVSFILQLVDKKTNFRFSFISPSGTSPNGKIQFKINGANEPLLSDNDEEMQIYGHFAKKLKMLLNETVIFHSLVNNEEFEDAIELNQQFDYKLEKIALELSKIERDLELVFHTDKPNEITNITAMKLSKLPPLTEIISHDEKNVLIDEYAKHNKAGTITVSLKDADSFSLLGSKITIRNELISLIENAYLNSTPVDITILNKDKIAPNNCKLSGEIIKIENTATLFRASNDEGESF